MKTRIATESTLVSVVCGILVAVLIVTVIGVSSLLNAVGKLL